MDPPGIMQTDQLNANETAKVEGELEVPEHVCMPFIAQ